MEESADRSRNSGRENAAAAAAAAGSAVDAAPGLARIAAGASMRTAGWYADTALRAGRRVAKAAINRENPLDLVLEARDEVLSGARALLGVTEIERRLIARAGDETGPLRDRGEALLTRSSRLEEAGDAHPAYSRILSELSPDEARILRLLAADGPQAAVDVRTWRPLNIGSHTVAPGLSMIGLHAGVMHAGRVPAYLSNLFRLGLIWFSRDQLPDTSAYQVLEAQPDVIAAIRATGRSRVVRRSIHLTPFGGHFCQFCLPVNTREFEAIAGPSSSDGVPPDEALAALPESGAPDE